ncbi:MAG: HNH endonuclease signature motif containing protein, partial [Pseudonocardia sp.]
PPSWCETHHLIPWEHGGPTSIDNLALVCRACHRLIHHAGWDVRLRDGRPEFLPPPWLDPTRRPRARPPHLQPPTTAAEQRTPLRIQREVGGGSAA